VEATWVNLAFLWKKAGKEAEFDGLCDPKRLVGPRKPLLDMTQLICPHVIGWHEPQMQVAEVHWPGPR